jgi:hypothetical protein
METLRHFPFARGRIAGAWVCLTAVLLLGAPMLAAAWVAHTMACCAGSMCAAHGNGKAKPSGKHQAAKEEAPLECAHASGSGMARCRISCCPDRSSSVASSAVYVLPKPEITSFPAEIPNPGFARNSRAVLQVFAPPSPPPKTSLP